MGYHPNQPKEAIIETDSRDQARAEALIIKVDADGEKIAKTVSPSEWGKFLRYNYLKVDFSTLNGADYVLFAFLGTLAVILLVVVVILLTKKQINPLFL